jgi:phosphoribosylformylglycinamidine cyclo-ligase
LGDELLKPSVIYAPAVLAAIEKADVHAVAHITGGGLPGNLNRVIPDTLDIEINAGSWDVPRIFGEIQRLGDITDTEMANVFNLGLGMVAVVAEADVFRAIDALRSEGHVAVEVGRVVPGTGAVHIV